VTLGLSHTSSTQPRFLAHRAAETRRGAGEEPGGMDALELPPDPLRPVRPRIPL